MADEHEKWLDRDAAERLLRGEPLEDVDPQVRARADRLAQALGALAADGRGAAAAEDALPGEIAGELPGRLAGDVPGDVPGELPGEAAALAAFRAARAGAGKAGARAPYATSAHEAAAAETVRLGRAADRPRPSRWGRPVRFGLAAALAGCMIGGVAVAAGTGVLPSPFGPHREPGPAASASPAATPEEEPEASPSDGAGEPSGGPAPDDGATPGGDGTTRAPEGSRAPEAEAGGAQTRKPTRRPGGVRPPRADGTKDWYRKVVVACRDYRSGGLQGEKRRRLEEFAKGPNRVEEFCGRILGGGQQNGGQPNGGHQGGGHGGIGGGHGDDDDGDGDGAPADGGAEGGSGGDTGGFPGLPSPTAPATPAASYSALPHLP
ncbi:Extensin OS=Streptomyces alboniger OX=132473 GN=CP975_21815 PE=4 SV=1 [Streptomyces alboniger]